MSIEGNIPDEIQAGPAAIRATVEAVGPAVRDVAVEVRRQDVHRIWVIGNGTSYHTAMYAAGLARRLALPDGPVVIAATAGDFRVFPPQLDERDLIIGVSASGEFRDVVGVFRGQRGRVSTVAVVHVPGSTVTTVADHVVLSAGGPSAVPVMTKTFSSTLSATAMLVGAILGDAAFAQVSMGLRAAADSADRAIAASMPVVEELASNLVAAEHLFVVGGGLAYPAALEAALKLKEMALVHAEASETWEMATGPATMVNADTVVISLAPDGAARAATDDVARKCADWGARIVEVAATRAISESTLLAIPSGTDELFAPLTVVPPVALLAYVLAGLRGATPDRPGWTERYHSQGLTHILGA